MVAVCFLFALVAMWFFRNRFEWLVFVASLVWGLFAFWEQYCKTRGYNIRVDLFLIFPILLAVTLVGVIASAVPGLATRRAARQFSMRSLMILVTLIALAMGAIAWFPRGPLN